MPLTRSTRAAAAANNVVTKQESSSKSIETSENKKSKLRKIKEHVTTQIPVRRSTRKLACSTKTSSPVPVVEHIPHLIENASIIFIEATNNNIKFAEQKINESNPVRKSSRKIKGTSATKTSSADLIQKGETQLLGTASSKLRVIKSSKNIIEIKPKVKPLHTVAKQIDPIPVLTNSNAGADLNASVHSRNRIQKNIVPELPIRQGTRRTKQINSAELLKSPALESITKINPKTPSRLKEMGAKKIMNSWTPVLEKRKAATKDTFPGRLDWKHQFFGMPATSTPKVVQRHASVAKTDVETCFGFDESDDENYSALISPIASVSKNHTPHLMKPTVLKRTQRDESQVLQQNQCNEQPKISLLEISDQSVSNLVDEVNKPDVKPRKVYARTRQLKTKNPQVLSTVVPKKKTKKIVPQINPSTHMYELDDFISSQQLEIDVSTSVSECEEIFVKEGKGDAGFNALLARYGNSNDDELEFRIDPGKIKRTYTSQKREHKEVTSFLPKKKPARRSTVHRNNLKDECVDEEDVEDHEDVVDPKILKWLEQKNKEFDDVLHVPLIVTKGEACQKN